MDKVTKLGGRKFLMALLVIGIAVFLEVSGRGLTPTMAGFLVGIAGMFSASNVAATSSFLSNKKSGMPSDTIEKIDELHETVRAGFAPERTEELKQLLGNINTSISQATALSGQTAQAMLNLSQVLSNVKRN